MAWLSLQDNPSGASTEMALKLDSGANCADTVKGCSSTLDLAWHTGLDRNEEDEEDTELALESPNRFVCWTEFKHIANHVGSVHD